jgi:hypothetical protein
MMLRNSKIICLGVMIGLLIGPLIGLGIINLSNVSFLEVRFALSHIFLGIVIGIVSGVVVINYIERRVSVFKWSWIWASSVLALIIDVAEVVIMLRRIIP